MSASGADSAGGPAAEQGATAPGPDGAATGPNGAAAPTGAGTWIVLPTYNEIENLEPMVTAIVGVLPQARVLVVDDNSPDGTGELADRLAATDDRVSVLHRPGKQGLGMAYRDGFRWVLAHDDARIVVQMDCDFSHDPHDLPRLVAPIERGAADLVLGTRYMDGGGTPGWGLLRKALSGGGTTFARTVLLLPYRDLTGGFKAWRRGLLESIRLREVETQGYGFQVEMTWWAHRRGARIVQIPIVFRERVAGASKMKAAIVGEAMFMVLRLRADSLTSRRRRRGPV